MSTRLLIILCIIGLVGAVRPPKSSNVTSAVRCRACETLVAGLGPLIRANASTARTAADQRSFATAAVKLCHTNRFDCNTTHGCEQACLDMAHEPMDKLVGVVLKFMDPVVVCQFMGACANDHLKTPSRHTPITPVHTNINDIHGERQWPAWTRHHYRGHASNDAHHNHVDDNDNDGNDGYFIQISDIHLDMMYEMGTLARCDQLLCCRTSSNATHISHEKGTIIDSDVAGYFGHYQCDSNIELAKSLFRYLSTLDPEPDFILYTGDDPAHDVTQQSRESNLAVINRISALFVKYLPHIPVFHALGNHDSYPVDQFAGPGDDQWLYDTVASNWHHWLPTEALRTIRFGGFYTARARPGLRVVSLNTNVYIPLNRYLQMNNYTDWCGQLDWLVDILHQSHRAHERVIIIGHAVSTAWDGHYAHRFHKIIEQFQHVIAGQFYGHYHSSSFRVFYDTDTNSVPINMAYIGGSITPFKNMNPGYRVYRYDRSLQYPWLVTDAQQYWADLDRANTNHRTLMNVINTGVTMPLLPSSSLAAHTAIPSLSSSSSSMDDERMWSTLNDWHVLRWSSRRDLGIHASSPKAWSHIIDGIEPNTTSIASSHLYQQLYWQYYRGVAQPSFDGRYYSLTRTELYCSLQSPTHRWYRRCLVRYNAAHRTPDAIAAPHPRPFVHDPATLATHTHH